MKKSRIIGQQRHKPFPVVNMRLRPADLDEACGVQVCESEKLLGSRQKGIFLGQICGDTSMMNNSAFTPAQNAELTWEKAYRDQLSGKEPDMPIGAICIQCAQHLASSYLTSVDESEVAVAIASAISSGKDIILYNRNITRDKLYPALAIGHFDTLADFRRQYERTQSHE